MITCQFVRPSSSTMCRIFFFLIVSIINQIRLKYKLIIKARCKLCSAVSMSPRRKSKFPFPIETQLPLLHRHDQIFENVATQWRFACECGSQRVVDDILILPAWLAAVKGSKKSAGIRCAHKRNRGPCPGRSCDWREESSGITVRNSKVATRKLTVVSRHSRC